MPRTFGSNFNTEKNKVKNAAPFLTAIIRFGVPRGGDLALVGRGIDAIGGRSPTIGGIVHHAVVKDWGTLGSGFGAQSDGTPDLIETTITCNNFPVIEGYRLSDRFVAEMETIPIDIFWNFIVSSTVYQEDGPSGSIHAPTTYGLREVSLRVTSLMDTYLMRDVLHIIRASRFPNAPQEFDGKAIPLAIGDTATNTNFDGARIPAVVIDEHQPSAPITGGSNTFALIACEAPLTGLTVTSLGSRYWQGHKIVEQDFTIDTSGTSADFPLFGEIPSTGPVQGRSEAFGYFDPNQNFDLADYGSPSSDTVRVGFTPLSATPPIGELGYQVVVQPFRYDYPVRLTNLRVPMTGTDAYALWSPAAGTVVGDGEYTGSMQPLGPAGLKVIDEDTRRQGPDGDIFTFNEPDKINAQRYAEAMAPIANWDSITPQAVGQEFDGVSGFNYRAAHFPLHGFQPIVGKTYYAMFYSSGSGSGVPDDPGNQFYSIKQTSSPHAQDSFGGFGDPTTFVSPAFGLGGERVSSGFFPGFTQQFKQYPFTNYVDMIIDSIVDGGPGSTGSTEDGADVGTSGLFQMSIEPEDARVIGAITLYIKQRLPAGSGGSSPIDLTGSLTITINEVDRFGSVIGSLASASFSAEDAVSILNTSNYQPMTQFLSSPALLLAGHQYTLNIGGELDAQGKFSGWQIQGITNPTFTGSGLSPGHYGASRFNASQSRVPINTDAAEPVSIRITLFAVKFDTSIETWDGVRCWTLRPYCLNTDKRFVVPSGTDVSSDANCSLSQPDVVVHALLNRAGVPDARIDLAGTFTESAAFYSAATWLLRGAVCEQITYKALIARLAFESRSDFDWEFHKAQLKWLPQPGDTVTSARTVTFADMPQVGDQDPLPDFHVARTETDSIINVVNVSFQRMFNVGKGPGAYLLGDQFSNTPSINVHGPKTNDALFQMDFVRDAPSAQALGEFYILWLAFALPKPIFTTLLQTLELMKGDVIVLDLTSLVAGSSPGDVLGGGGILGDESILGDVFGAFNGWTEQPVLIRAIQHDWNTRRIQYTAVVI